MLICFREDVNSHQGTDVTDNPTRSLTPDGDCPVRVFVTEGLGGTSNEREKGPEDQFVLLDCHLKLRDPLLSVVFFP